MEGLEETRSLHEQRDKLEISFVEEMMTLNSSNHRERIEKEHKLKDYLDQYVNCSKSLHSIYSQRLGKRRTLSENPFHEFYILLNEILDKNLDVAIITPEENEENEELVQSSNTKNILFTDEEGHGKYFDLNQGHMAYCQLVKIDYLTFIREFETLSSKIDHKLKSSNAYKLYLDTMLDYFRDFSRRSKPLLDYEELEAKVEEEVNKEWTKNRIDLDNIETWEELASLGLDRLKSELQALGLKCGGSLDERAKRLISVKGKKPDEIDLSLRPHIMKMAAKSNKKIKLTNNSLPTTMNPYQVSLCEAKLAMYGDYYNDIKLATIENVQRKQSRTAEERNESDEDASDIDLDDNDDGEAVYNPKNLPLGWDGKPIPYWLYKLHGLNLTFTCEICGNSVYKGPKTFQRHFAEWRHAQGMNALGIPNTAHFANITKIQDAVVLWSKLRAEKEKVKFEAPMEEEFEDSQGNVVNKKTYEDLKRQGLL